MKAWTKTAWTGALLLSLLVHGGAAVLLAGRDEPVQIAGGNPVDIAGARQLVRGRSLGWRDNRDAGARKPPTSISRRKLKPQWRKGGPVAPATAEAVSAETAGNPETAEVSEVETGPHRGRDGERSGGDGRGADRRIARDG